MCGLGCKPQLKRDASESLMFHREYPIVKLYEQFPLKLEKIQRDESISFDKTSNKTTPSLDHETVNYRWPVSLLLTAKTVIKNNMAISLLWTISQIQVVQRYLSYKEKVNYDL